MALALLLVFSAACASAVRGDRVSGEEMLLEVHNNLVPGKPVTVRAVSSSGARLLVGAVSPNQTRVLRLRQPNFVGSYRFVAEVDGSGQFVSTPVILSPGLRVVWTLRTNLLRIAERDRGDPRFALGWVSRNLAGE